MTGASFGLFLKQSYYIIQIMSWIYRDLRGQFMKKTLAGAILGILLLLGTVNIMPMTVCGATAEVACEIASGSASNDDGDGQGAEAEDETSDEDDQDVLGKKRDTSAGEFIIGVEVAIGIIFLIGLISAGKSGYEK